jgi:hypothetical protein
MQRALLLPLLVLLTLLQGVGPLIHAHRDGPPSAGAVHLHAGVVAPIEACAALASESLRGRHDAFVTAPDGLVEARHARLPVPDAAAAPPASLPAAPRTLPAPPSAPAQPLRARPSATAWLHPPTHAPPQA